MLARQLPSLVVQRHVSERGLTDRKKAHLVIGPRQAGKSTWVWTHLKNRPSKTVLWINAESSLLAELTKSASLFLATLDAHFPSVDTLFIDEAHHLSEAGLFIKSLVDARRGLDIWATGSSSYHLASQTRESLAGRATRRKILPFSLRELAERDNADGSTAVAHMRRRAHVEKQLIFGAYPPVWFAADPAYELADLLEAFVIRDASDRFHIERPDVFRRLLQLLASQSGQMVRFSEWAALLGVAVGTVRNYLSLLEESWLVKQLPPFAAGKRSELTSAGRLFFYDNGLRNATLNAFSLDLERRTDRGALYESLCFAELEKTLPDDWTLHYWRTKSGAEVDFVCAHNERIIAVEMKAGKRPILSRGARSFIEAYAPRAFILVGDSAAEPENVRGTTLYRVPIEQLAKTVSLLLQ